MKSMALELDVALVYLKKLAKEVEHGSDEAIIEMIDIIENLLVVCWSIIPSLFNKFKNLLSLPSDSPILAP